MKLMMRLVRIHLLRQLRIGVEAFFIVFRHETVRSFMAVVIVTVVQWRLVAKFHRLEDKIVVMELEWSAANRDKRCQCKSSFMNNIWMKREDQI